MIELSNAQVNTINSVLGLFAAINLPDSLRYVITDDVRHPKKVLLLVSNLTTTEVFCFGIGKVGNISISTLHIGKKVEEHNMCVLEIFKEHKSEIPLMGVIPKINFFATSESLT